MRIVLASRLAASPWMNPARWADRPVAVIDSDTRPHRWRRLHSHTTLATGVARQKAAARVRAALLAGRIFPPDLMIVVLSGMTVAPEHVLAQGFRIGPIGLIAASRIAAVFDRRISGSRRTGFSYLTLAGHLARGATTITVIEDDRAEVARFEINAVTQPEHWLARLAPSLALQLQQEATRAAMINMRRLAVSVAD